MNNTFYIVFLLINYIIPTVYGNIIAIGNKY